MGTAQKVDAVPSPMHGELMQPFLLANKCKFSHDLNVERKAAKVNIYEDVRQDKKDGAACPRSFRMTTDHRDPRSYGDLG